MFPKTLNAKFFAAFLLAGLLGFCSIIGPFAWLSVTFNVERGDPVINTIASIVESYYQRHKSFANVESLFVGRNLDELEIPFPVAIVAADGMVVYGETPFQLGTQLADMNGSCLIDELCASTDIIALKDDGEPVGWLAVGNPLNPGHVSSLFANIVWLTIVWVLLTIGLLSFIAWLFARSISRPVATLTAVTQQIAQGREVQVGINRRNDELGVLASSIDQMSQQLADARKARQQMTADIVHDLRTPLTVLRGYLEPLTIGSAVGTLDLYEIMHKEVIYLQRLVDDLRTISLADAKALELERRPIEIGPLIEKVAQAHQAAARENSVSLSTQILDPTLTWNLDEARLTQVLDNLISNALRYTGEGDGIRLLAQLTQDETLLESARSEVALSGEHRWRRGEQTKNPMLLIQLEDTGVGIASAHLPHIFERFYRADPARMRSADTTSGLGLAIAKSIVEAHGGTISVRSTPNCGTAFTILLSD